MSSQTRRPVAFVIMPFSDAFNHVFNQLIRPALEGYEVIRADSHLDQQNILQNIVEGIHRADLVIADVTGMNANVMYELGAAHALGKPTVMMSQSISGLPFDLRSYLVQAYAPSGQEADAFSERLREIGKKHIAGLVRFGNPITDFLPHVALISETKQDVPSAPADVHDENYGFLDYSADMEEYGELVLGQFGQLNALSFQLTADVRELAPAVAKARASGSAKAERRLMKDLAALMNKYADSLTEEILPRFHEGWDRIGHAMHWMASQKPDDVTPSMIANVCTSGRELREALSGMIMSITAVRDTISTGRGRTGVLDKAIVAMEQAFNNIVSEVMIADATLVAVYARLGCAELSTA